MAIIEAEELRKEFVVWRKVGRLRRQRQVVSAVDGVSLRVEQGETLGYLGPNGAGKSTTLKMFTGVLAPSSGRLRVCGLEPVSRRVQLTRQIGVVFGQRSQLWWDLPLRDSFALLRHVFRIPQAEHAARLAQCRELLGLDEFLDTPVRQLSLGQRMRGELTAALLHGPRVLFLDEPTIGLDVVSKQAVRAFLTQLRDQGEVTVVLTTHDLADIERLCRRLVIIDHGRVVHDGSLEALHARYGSRRRVVVDLDAPWEQVPGLSGAVVEAVEAEGHRVTFSLAEGVTAGHVITQLAGYAALRDISIVEPDIEEVIARLYAASDDARSVASG